MKFNLKHLLGVVFLVSLALAGWRVYLNFQFHSGDGPNVECLELILKDLNESDPSKDATDRIKTGDMRCFAGYWGEPGGPFFPGVPYLIGKTFETLDNTGLSMERLTTSNRAIIIHS